MDKIANNRIVKIGIVVRNIEDVAQRYGALFHIETPVVHHPDPDKPTVEGAYKRYHGKDARILLKTCIIDLEPLYLEMLEPCDDTPSPWLDHLEKHGPGVCFISFHIQDFEYHQNLMEQGGYPLAFFEEKGFERYGYFETLGKLGVTMEFKEQGEKRI